MSYIVTNYLSKYLTSTRDNLISLYFNQQGTGSRSSCDVVANELDCDIVENEFEIQSRKGMKPP